MGASKHNFKIAEIEKLIGHNFADTSLLTNALTHPSIEGDNHYQRLEFLGDRVLGLIIANWLYETYENENEGQLSRRFIGLVRKETLADVALAIGIGEHINLKLASGKESAANIAIQADVVEAIIAAIYRDAGLEAASRFVKIHFAPFLENISSTRDPKSALQEHAQGKGLALPQYILEKREGPDHAPIFYIKVSVENLGEAKATGSSKREAEVSAAQILLDQINSKQK